ncbi:TMEM175 family protein [Caulobacter segnis]|uniref:TMEM175 family protein n=1 Tax=Caulobacter segnis TaxID=88688 RepID=UPI0028572414|nr:TMEM175 family protein [Caulobacter segnis]MDR6627620.1 putative membrane protein [Caulobacter segnis]
MSDRDSGRGDAHLHRLVLFSDAVFAIAITLLAIEIHPPEHWHGAADLFGQMGPKLLSYAVSFAVIGVCWFSHRRVFSRLVRADGGLDFTNFLVLGLIGLLPLGTELLWEQRGGQALPIYVGQVALIGVAMGAVWGYAAFIGKLTEPMPAAEAWFIWLRVTLLPGLMCGLTMFSIVHPWGWALMALLVFGLSWLGRRIVRAPAKAA